MSKLIPGKKPIINQINKKLTAIIGQDLPILKKVKSFVIKSGGKRIRPLTHYYFAKMLGYKGNEWCDVGAIGELIHAASLLHDDVIDQANVRRGKPSVNAIYGNATAVLSGDYLLACGLDQLCSLEKSTDLIRIFTQVLKDLSVGELLQMQWEHNFKLQSNTYQRIINGKTGSLFGAMTQSAYIISNKHSDYQIAQGYKKFGEKMGRLFQIRDDYLDYFGSSTIEGKDSYQDYKRGLVTIPLIMLRDRLSIKKRNQFKKVFQNEEKRTSSQGATLLIELLDEMHIKKLLAQEIEKDIHSLMNFLRDHPGTQSRELMIEQLRTLQVPINI